MYLTGLDAHAPTAVQASLMLKEKVWLHAEGLPLAGFRHGPVEVMEEGVPVVLIGHGKEKIKPLLMHADFLSNVCHGDVALVTDSKETWMKGYRNFPMSGKGQKYSAIFALHCLFSCWRRGWLRKETMILTDSNT